MPAIPVPARAATAIPHFTEPTVKKALPTARVRATKWGTVNSLPPSPSPALQLIQPDTSRWHRIQL